MMSMNEFKELMLTEGFDSNIKYKVKIEEVDETFFNGSEEILEYWEEHLRGSYDFHDLSEEEYEEKQNEYGSLEDHSTRDIAFLLYILYNKNIQPFIDGGNVGFLYDIRVILPYLDLETNILLLKDFTNPEHNIRKPFSPREENPNYNITIDFFDFVNFCNNIRKLGGDLKEILTDDMLKEIIRKTYYVDMDRVENDEFFDYIIDNFDIKDFIEESGYPHVRSFLYKKLLDKDLPINFENKYGLDTMLYEAFINKSIDVVKTISSVLGSINPKKLDKSVTKGVKTEVSYPKLVRRDIIEVLSNLENFDDFLRNNKYLLVQFIDEEAFDFIESFN